MISSYTQDLYYETNIHFKKRGVNSDSIVRCMLLSCLHTTKKAKIREGILERENVKSLYDSVTKFYDQRICERFYFFRH